jgi:hypothetical protein
MPTVEKLRSGWTYWLEHSSGGAFHSSGEARFFDDGGTQAFGNKAIIDLVEDDSLGLYSEAPSIEGSVELFEDKPVQEGVPEQVAAISGEFMFKALMRFGIANKTALAAGAVSATAKTLSSRAGKGVVMGPRQPAKLSLLHIATKLSDPTLREFCYMPNVRADMNQVIALKRGTIKESEITFKLLASAQDELLLPDGRRHAPWSIFSESAATFGKVLRFDLTGQTTDQWDAIHKLGSKEAIAAAYDVTNYQVLPDELINQNVDWLRIDWLANQDTKAVVLVCGISSDVSSDGKSYIHRQYAENTTWDIHHELNHTHPVVFCFDWWGKQFIPDEIEATDAGNVTITLVSAMRGYVLVVAEGPNGVFSQAKSGASWTVTHNLSKDGVIVACYDNSTPPKMILPDSVLLTSNDVATVGFAAAQTGQGTVVA